MAEIPLNFFYSDGVMTLTNGSDIVTGTFTSWDPGVQPMDIVFPNDGQSGASVVDQVLSATEMRLAKPWTGPTLTDVPYFILRWIKHTDPRRYGLMVSEYLARLKQIPTNFEEIAAEVAADRDAVDAALATVNAAATEVDADRAAADTARTAAETARAGAEAAQAAAEAAAQQAAAGAIADGAVTDIKVAQPSDPVQLISSAKLRFEQGGAGAVPRDVQGKLREVQVSIRDFRSVIDADDTNSFNRALTYIASKGAGTVTVPADRTTLVSAVTTLPKVSSTHIKIRGESGFSSRIQRTGGYTGEIFVYPGASITNCTVVIEGLFFFSDYASDPAPTAPTIDLRGPMFQAIVIRDCQFWDQWCAIRNTGCHNVWMESLRIHYSFEAATAATKFAGVAGIIWEGHIAGNYVNNVSIYGQAISSDNNLTYGMLIKGADGIQITNSSVTAYTGIRFQAGNGANIDDIYLSNVIIDFCNFRGVHISGNNGSSNVYINLRFDGCHIDAGSRASPSSPATSAVVIDGNCDGVWFDNCNIGQSESYGVYINGATRWDGAAKSNILFTGCTVVNNNKLNQSGVGGYYVNSPGVSIVGGFAGNHMSFGHQKYGVSIGPNGGGTLINGVRLAGNEDAPIYVEPGILGVMVTNCPGFNSKTINVTAAASVVFPATGEVFAVSGATSVTTISGGWDGREVTILAVGGFTLATGGNIGRGKTLANYEMCRLRFSNGMWFVQ